MKRAAWILVWCSLAWAEWPHINGELKDKHVAIRKVVVLPAQVEFDRVGTRGSEGGIPEANWIAAAFRAAVAKELAARGVEVEPNPLAEASDDSARYAVADLQTRFDNVVVQVRKKPGHVEKGRYTMGDGVAQFEPALGADAIVFLRGAGRILTPGRKAVAAATWGGMWDTFHGELTFVNARTGEVLAFLRFSRARDMTQKTDERFAENVRYALRELPLPLPAPK